MRWVRAIFARRPFGVSPRSLEERAYLHPSTQATFAARFSKRMLMPCKRLSKVGTFAAEMCLKVQTMMQSGRRPHATRPKVATLGRFSDAGLEAISAVGRALRSDRAFYAGEVRQETCFDFEL